MDQSQDNKMLIEESDYEQLYQQSLQNTKIMSDEIKYLENLYPTQPLFSNRHVPQIEIPLCASKQEIYRIQNINIQLKYEDNLKLQLKLSKKLEYLKANKINPQNIQVKQPIDHNADLQMENYSNEQLYAQSLINTQALLNELKAFEHHKYLDPLAFLKVVPARKIEIHSESIVEKYRIIEINKQFEIEQNVRTGLKLKQKEAQLLSSREKQS